MRHLLLSFALAFSFVIAAAGAQPQVTNPTAAYANQTVSNASYYLSQVNESGYLIFYPNLTQAYSDLFKAESAYNTSPATAVVYANKAVGEAAGEYARISDYRAESIIVMSASIAVLIVLLGRVARQVKRQKGK